MTDAEIINALECCGNMECNDDCPLFCKYGCQNYLITKTINLIKRQQAEIAELKTANFVKTDMINYLQENFKIVKVETVKEFTEKFLKKVHDNHYVLKDAINSTDYGMFTAGIEQAVNETKKEMVGANNDR